jgi:hypothetical protein
VFFLAGVYLRPALALAGFMLEALLLDVVAVTWGGVSGFCLSPAYVFLIPAHATLWAAGRWYAARHRWGWSTLLTLVGSLFAGVAVAELLASGGFYLFSGRFVDLSLAELGGRLSAYFPSSVEALAFYVGLAMLVHLGLARRHASRIRATARGS